MIGTELVVSIDTTPEQVMKGLSEGLIPGYVEGHGFSDRRMVVPTRNFEFITFELSFDGELELIGVVITNLYGYPLKRCREILLQRFQ